MEDPDFVWDKQTLIDFDPLLPHMPLADFERINTADLLGYWKEKNATFPMKMVGFYILKKL